MEEPTVVEKEDTKSDITRTSTIPPLIKATTPDLFRNHSLTS